MGGQVVLNRKSRSGLLLGRHESGLNAASFPRASSGHPASAGCIGGQNCTKEQYAAKFGAQPPYELHALGAGVKTPTIEGKFVVLDVSYESFCEGGGSELRLPFTTNSERMWYLCRAMSLSVTTSYWCQQCSVASCMLNCQMAHFRRSLLAAPTVVLSSSHQMNGMRKKMVCGSRLKA